MNYNTFQTTILIFPAMHISLYILQLRAELEHYFDQDGKLIDDVQAAQIFETRMQSFVGITLLCMFFTWLIQLDLIIQTIKNNISTRQQSELKEFFSENDDPVIITDEKGKVIFFNEVAREMYAKCGVSEINEALSAKVFQKQRANMIENSLQSSETSGEGAFSLHDFSGATSTGTELLKVTCKDKNESCLFFFKEKVMIF